MITEADIRGLTNAQSYARGEGYYASGKVYSVVRRGDLVQAQVGGSGPWPYQVVIELDGDELDSASCTCPYDWGDYCKHIVAVLLTLVRDAGATGQIQARPSVDEMLAGLDAETLRGLLRDIAARQPDLATWLEAQIALAARPVAPNASKEAGQAPQPPRPAVDDRTIRRLVRDAMNVSGGYGAAAAAVEGLEKVLDLARKAVEQSDGESALAIVQIIAETATNEWTTYDDSDGDFGDLFRALGEVLAEAILTASLAPARRDAWQTQLQRWHDELGDYGLDDAFGVAILAAQQGWDDPILRRKLAGGYVLVVRDGLDDGDGEGSQFDEESGAGLEGDDLAEWYGDDLLAIRFRVLERQGRIEEYLNLAMAEGEVVPYTIMLLKLDRADEAVDFALHNLISPEEALPVARALHERGDLVAALRIGEHALGLGCGQPGALARWLRDAATAQGRPQLALRAARIAFEADATLADYKILAALAGPEWAALKPEMLARLAAHPTAYERIDIYLFEGMVDEAIRVFSARPFSSPGDLEKVASAAVQSRPDWVILTCRNQAEPIMNGAQSTQYPVALHWLGLVRNAYLAAGRPNEWRAYCEGLLTQHARKYRLTPGLKELLSTQRTAGERTPPRFSETSEV